MIHYVQVIMIPVTTDFYQKPREQEDIIASGKKKTSTQNSISSENIL